MYFCKVHWLEATTPCDVCASRQGQDRKTGKEGDKAIRYCNEAHPPRVCGRRHVHGVEERAVGNGGFDDAVEEETEERKVEVCGFRCCSSCLDYHTCGEGTGKSA